MPAGDLAYFETVVGVWSARGIQLAPGLSEDEVAFLEARHGFRFPPDLRMLLQLALPVDKGFLDWRGAYEKIDAVLSWPVESICFDVECNGLWLPDWGERPENSADAVNLAGEKLAAAPRLIPIYSHRYICVEPPESGNAVLSVYQADIIPYGDDLPGYLQKEFDVPPPAWARVTARAIRFWDDLVLLNNARM